ncbi:MAG TPA: hypothetical protein VFM28_07995 [Nitrososphaeraceae archaeon]|nr:hypothetical protein [Nitrososphaeraceae archaeon]
MKAILLLLLSSSLSIVILSIVGIITTPSVFAQQKSSLDLTTPTATDLYGGDKKGILNLNVQEETVIVNATMNEPPADGKVYEGWFEDKGDASGYSLSLGKFDEETNTLSTNRTMVNPFTYTIFYVTAEPVNDPDPKPSDVVVATKLPIPFGQ